MFDRHRVEAFGGVFHVPDFDAYPALFAWDSGYHALSLRHIDPELAVGELSTLYEANRLPDGLLSHQRFVPGAEDTQRMIEGLFGPMFEGDRTPFVDPPTAAYAAARMSASLGRPADHLLDEALRNLRSLATYRRVEGCVLPAVLHPFETGTEGNAFTGPLARGKGLPDLTRLKELTVSAVSSGMSPQRALSEGHDFVVYDPTVCGWYILALEEAASACALRGRDADRDWATRTAQQVADAAASLLWSESDDLFGAYDLVRGRRLGGVGAMGLIPAATRAMVERACQPQRPTITSARRRPCGDPEGLLPARWSRVQAFGTSCNGTAMRSGARRRTGRTFSRCGSADWATPDGSAVSSSS